MTFLSEIGHADSASIAGFIYIKQKGGYSAHACNTESGDICPYIRVSIDFCPRMFIFLSTINTHILYIIHP